MICKLRHFGWPALFVGATLAATWPAPTGAAQVAAGPTTSYYEAGASPQFLALQGEKAGQASFRGVVILDFGRPAFDGSSEGTMGFGGTFLPFASIATGVENYISGYYRTAPPYVDLKVALGTNNSCGTGQRCGSVRCGCPDEPTDYAYWGRQLALTVEAIDAWSRTYGLQHSYTDEVRAIAADDAEPAFDPGYANTYAALSGYAEEVGGTQPAMIDFGSAEGSYWTEEQLYQVAYGLPPDVPMPEIYYPVQAAQWADLVQYAKAHHGQALTIFGVLTSGVGANDPWSASSEVLRALSSITGQSSLSWSSNIAR